MMNSYSLLHLDDMSNDDISSLLVDAEKIENGKIDVASLMSNKVLVPIFLQESSRTFLNSTSSFVQMGGAVLPMALSNTRYGSKWSEPIQDFCEVVNSCGNFVVIRSPDVETVLKFSKFCELPIINAGNGSGVGSEHPVQALLDLFTIQKIYGESKLNILMMGGKHIRSARSQIKLFHKFGHELTIMSPPAPIANEDIDEKCRSELRERDTLEEVRLKEVDIIYHNGMDENPDVEAVAEYKITKKRLEELNFKGKVMHSLPRKKEMSSCLDDTDYNLYFEQIRNSKHVFQSVFLRQLNGGRYA